MNLIKANNNNSTTVNKVEDVTYITFPILNNISFIKHGFSTRLSGVSKEELSSMNLSFSRGDDRENVMENFRRITNAIGISYKDLVFSDQVHKTNIYIATAKDRGKGIIKESDIKEMDALITNEINLPLVTFYADCVPIYIVDPKNKAIGLAHSGWKGTVGKIGKETVNAMVREFNSNVKDLIAVVGPSICMNCYEVGEDVADQFKSTFSNEVLKEVLEYKKNGKYQLDLWNVNKYILLESGLLQEHIEITDICTCCNNKYLFSHRASNGKRGNLAAFLSLQ